MAYLTIIGSYKQFARVRTEICWGADLCERVPDRQELPPVQEGVRTHHGRTAHAASRVCHLARGVAQQSPRQCHRWGIPGPLSISTSSRQSCHRAAYRFRFTAAVIVGRIGEMVSYDDRWCYYDEQAAADALKAWDGTNEPLAGTATPLQDAASTRAECSKSTHSRFHGGGPWSHARVGAQFQSSPWNSSALAPRRLPATPHFLMLSEHSPFRRRRETALRA